MAEEVTKELLFYYEKSNFFRVIHADGAYGGNTPQGDIHIAFYNERHPIPKITSLPLIGNKRAGPEVVKERKEGIFREVEVDIVMNLNTAVAFRIWFDEKIEALRKQQGVSDQDWAKIQDTYRAK